MRLQRQCHTLSQLAAAGCTRLQCASQYETPLALALVCAQVEKESAEWAERKKALLQEM